MVTAMVCGPASSTEGDQRPGRGGKAVVGEVWVEVLVLVRGGDDDGDNDGDGKGREEDGCLRPARGKWC
jgi:hypothetical protein